MKCSTDSGVVPAIVLHRAAFSFALIFLISWPFICAAQTRASPNDSGFESALADRAIGRADAPITIELFSVLVCGPCAAHWKENYAKLKEQYVDTGKVRLIVHDYPWTSGIDRVSLLVRSTKSSEQAFRLMSHLFETQAEWANKGSRGLEYVRRSALQAGYSEEAVRLALESQELMRLFLTKMKSSVGKYGVSQTPTTVINGEIFRSGWISFALLKNELERLLLQAR